MNNPDLIKELIKYQNLAAMLVDTLLDAKDSCRCGSYGYRDGTACPRCAAIQKYQELTILDGD